MAEDGKELERMDGTEKAQGMYYMYIRVCIICISGYVLYVYQGMYYMYIRVCIICISGYVLYHRSHKYSICTCTSIPPKLSFLLSYYIFSRQSILPCPPQVKERCRKGIPDSLRGRIWMKLSGGDELLQQNPGLFDVINHTRLTPITH